MLTFQHIYLEVRSKFADWIKKRIADYDFVENQDFVTFSENYEKGRPRLEYALTLDMAKELAMPLRPYLLVSYTPFLKSVVISPLGLETALHNTILLKIKTLLSSPKLGSFQRQGRWLLSL